MNYTGYRVYISLTFGTMKDRIQVDIAVNDVLESKHESLKLYQYKGRPIFEGNISLQVYPIETIFSEKLESIITRGNTNSRMKDYHDLVLLCRKRDIFDLKKLKRDIAQSLKKKNILESLPIEFSDNELDKLQRLWRDHRSALHVIADHLKLSTHIKEVIKEINNWLFKNEIVP